MKRPFKSSNIVTDSANKMADELVGRRLAPFWRRGLALVLDLAVGAGIAMPILTLMTFFFLWITHPNIYHAMRAVAKNESPALYQEALNTLTREVIPLAIENRPELFTREAHEAYNNDDWQALGAEMGGMRYRINLGFAVPRLTESELDLSTPYLTIRYDAIFPDYPFIFDGLLFIIAYFSLIQWLWKGRTLGKWICRLRIQRLDGKPLSLMDSIGRAGGYSASFATLALGFLEAGWMPNRQALHDRISGTVVLDVKGR